MKNRKGKFKISDKFFNEILEKQNSELREKFFKHFQIVRAGYLYTEGVFEYVAYSPLFEELKFNEKIPEYEIIICVKIEGYFDLPNYKIKAERKY